LEEYLPENLKLEKLKNGRFSAIQGTQFDPISAWLEKLKNQPNYTSLTETNFPT